MKRMYPTYRSTTRANGMIHYVSENVDEDNQGVQNNYLFGAVYHRNNVQIMDAINRGATHFSAAASTAAIIGDMELLRRMIEYGNNNGDTIYYDVCARHAAIHNNREIFEWLYREHYHYDMDHSFSFAATNGADRVLAFGFSLPGSVAGSRLTLDPERMLALCIENGQMVCIELCVLNGARNFDVGLRCAARCGNLLAFKYFFHQGVTNFDECLRISIENKHYHIFRELLKTHPAVNREKIASMLFEALMKDPRNIDTIIELLSNM